YTAELGQRNSRGDFQSFVHVGGLDQDKAAQMLLGLGERSIRSHRSTLANSSRTRFLHRRERLGNYVVTAAVQLFVIGHRIATKSCFLARRKSGERFRFEVNQTYKSHRIAPLMT